MATDYQVLAYIPTELEMGAYWLKQLIELWWWKICNNWLVMKEIGIASHNKALAYIPSEFAMRWQG